MKVARGRAWQPEIGMEHASRGRRSGNKGVGARWRGRFRIFSARHCSRTKVSHAENSGMTMLFFFFGGCSGVGGGFFHTLGSGWHEGVGSGLRAASGEDGTRGLGFRATCRLGRGRHEGVSFRATCRLGRGRHEGVILVPPLLRRHAGFLVWGILSHALPWSTPPPIPEQSPKKKTKGAVPPREWTARGGIILVPSLLRRHGAERFFLVPPLLRRHGAE